MLGGDEFVVGCLAQVVNVVDEKGIGQLMLGKEDDLGSAEGQISRDLCSYACGTSLGTASQQWAEAGERATYCYHYNLGVHEALGGVDGASEIAF